MERIFPVGRGYVVKKLEKTVSAPADPLLTSKSDRGILRSLEEGRRVGRLCPSLPDEK